ncbi:DUF2933 domain-containing protein [uncultured Pseudophaeobacter sp.]|uniref:DUF2933 domain-containing protein n=1 Tax=uncultured Pseudophaeobacter sp. TaxID=1759421 RepID=UPI0025FCE864|nr:DUF2933 domain-containing protein [uncultured Pseudophaeobacter sp.]
MSQKTDTSSIERSRSGPKAMHFAMMACCVIMLLPIAGYFLAGGALGGLGSNLLTFAPLLLCVGGHFVMHKMMGKSCHTSGSRRETEEPNAVIHDVASTVPQVRRG